MNVTLRHPRLLLGLAALLLVAACQQPEATASGVLSAASSTWPGAPKGASCCDGRPAVEIFRLAVGAQSELRDMLGQSGQ